MGDDPATPPTLVESEDEARSGTVSREADTRDPPSDVRVATRRRGRLPGRYVDIEHVGQGGSGEVRRVMDLSVDRVVVMKLLRWEHIDPPGNPSRRRFENEARITASLEHPGVVPVHDQGKLLDHRPWFTMKEVRGERFDQAIRALHRAPLEARDARRRSLLEALLRVAETVGYAHSRGVVHRDLKPANLMRGAFGQVYVMDWGVANDGVDPVQVAEELARDVPWRPLRAEDVPVLEKDGDRALTRQGAILGTVPYMSPEQARGWNRAIGAPSDVWALALVLYEILVGERAYPAPEHERVWKELIEGRGPRLPAGLAVPAELRALVEASTRTAGAERLADATMFAERLRDWLAGEARRERARGVLREVDTRMRKLDVLRGKEAEERAKAEEALGPLHANDPDEGRRFAGWRAEDRADALRDAVDDEEATILQLLRTALQHDPDSTEAHARIASLAHAEVLAAEARGEPREAKRWERMLAEHDDGRFASFLAGMGEVVLDSTPSGAEVTLHRYVEEDRQLVPRPIEDPVTRTPLRRSLAAGSYLAVLRAPGHAEVRYPFVIARATTWDARPPEADAPLPVLLPEASALGPGDCYVPAGWCTIGEPGARGEAYARTRVWLEGFVIKRYPVTVREYAEYLQALADAGDAVAVEAAAPRNYDGNFIDVRLTPDGQVVVRGRDAGINEVVAGETPARSLSWSQVSAYAAWRAARERLPWRLPHDGEWEKAARGVDARIFPWGRTPVASWAVTIDHDPPGIKSMEAAPRDESPYGLRHVAGNVAEICQNRWLLRPTLDARGRVTRHDPSEERVLFTTRGGAFAMALLNPPLSRRFAIPEGDRRRSVGFRLARSL
ncbi:MAG: bifunctional serine/threonine-protein kinase/formylglycine-generating enzyme family protein [Myxococcota bacterium]